ncbi:MAG: ribulose-phosphate 3-epimerase [Anaerolineales bacterium]|nr:ribulose-phosphate 3-epimerase [Anaerolineales bacterium]
MASKPLIAPSILSADFGHLAEQIALAEQAGADWLHIDVMDGHFVPPITMGQIVTQVCRTHSQLPLDVHLMVEAPDGMLASFAEAGADHIHIHVEASPDPAASLRAIRALGCKAGLALNPPTPVERVLPYLAEADIVLVMSVNPGRSGQAFIPESLAKIRILHEAIEAAGLDTLIELDGGIDASTLPAAFAAGGSAFVAGNAVFAHPQGIAAGVRALRNAQLVSQN